MVMLVDPTQERTALQFMQQNPVQGFDPGFIERFKSDYSSMMDFSNANARERHREDIEKEFIRGFYQESGISVPAWLSGFGLKANVDDEKIARGQFDAWKKENPESSLVFPDEGYIQSETLKRAGDARQKSVKLQGLSTGWGSTIGGFAGTATGALRDPINAISLAFGAGAATGVLRTALVEGAIGMASETAIQGINYGFKQEVDPNFGLRDALYEIGAAGAGGAALGGGIKGIAAAWHRAKVGEWPRHTVDAGNLVTREASVPASRLDTSAQGAAVYRGAVEKAADDLFRGNPVEIPQEAFLQANARPGRIYDADGRSVGVQYEVIEADQLITSNLDDMSINPDFPAELQPRDRTRAISQDQINSIAGNLQPERLGPSADAANGAPVVGSEGFVESGNGRVMAMRRAYLENGPSSESYRNFLRSQNFDIEGFNKPVLIARRITDLDPESRIGFVTAANRSTAMRLGAAEQALSDARLIDDAVLSKLRDAGDVDTISNRDFVRGFMKKLPRAEQGELVDASGALSQTGERRVMAALMGRAYGEPSLLGRALEDADSNIKSLAGSLGDSAGSWAIMRDAVVRGDIPRGMDITDDLMNAVGLVMRARDEGRPVADLINQAEMFGGPNEIAKILARAMFGDENMKRAISRKRLTAFLRDYADEALKNDSGARLFGEPLQSSDVLRNSLSKADREDLIAVANDRLTPEHMQEVAKAQDTSDAVIREAQRLIDEGVPTEQARVRRAISQGFAVEAFHGTNAVFKDFDSAFLGGNTGAQSAKKGFFFAKNSETAHAYLNDGEMIVFSDSGDISTDQLDKLPKSVHQKVRDAQAAHEKAVSATEIGDDDAYDFFSDKASRLWDEARAEAEAELQAGNNIRPVRLKMENPLIYDMGGNRYREITYSDLIDQAKSQGHDSLIIKNTFDGGPEDDIFAVFNENQIRSRFDQFEEPAKEPIMIDLGDGAGERPLSEIFAEADAEIKAASDIEACTLGNNDHFRTRATGAV